MIDYEKIRQQLLRKVQSKFSKKNKTIGQFAKKLFALGLAEDLARYDADSIAKFATAIYQTLSIRKPGRPLINFNTYEAISTNSDGTKKSITTIDIINDDMPFLIDSIVPELRELGHEIILIAHPVLSVDRDKGGKLNGPPALFKTSDKAQGTRESVMHIHINAISPAEQRALKTKLNKLLNDVRGVVKDWPKMMGNMQKTITIYKENPPPIAVNELAEAIQFLSWLMENNFTFL
ncbi:MAG: hypothetical protein ABJZ62_04535, partial [Hyphomicrobiales bacterium]